MLVKSQYGGEDDDGDDACDVESGSTPHVDLDLTGLVVIGGAHGSTVLGASGLGRAQPASDATTTPHTAAGSDSSGSAAAREATDGKAHAPGMPLDGAGADSSVKQPAAKGDACWRRRFWESTADWGKVWGSSAGVCGRHRGHQGDGSDDGVWCVVPVLRRCEECCRCWLQQPPSPPPPPTPAARSAAGRQVRAGLAAALATGGHAKQHGWQHPSMHGRQPLCSRQPRQAVTQPPLNPRVACSAPMFIYICMYVYPNPHVQQTAAIVQRHPMTALLPLGVFCLMVGLGVWGVMAAAESTVQAKKDAALGVAVDAATGFEASRRRARGRAGGGEGGHSHHTAGQHERCGGGGRAEGRWPLMRSLTRPPTPAPPAPPPTHPTLARLNFVPLSAPPPPATVPFFELHRSSSRRRTPRVSRWT